MIETETYLSSFDGTQLFLHRSIPPNPKSVFIFLHGLAEDNSLYQEPAELFVQQGHALYRYDHRGHGKSGGRRAYYKTFDEIAKDAKTVVDFVKKEHPTLPIFIGGHSLGGYGAILFGTLFPGRVQGIIATGAATRYNCQLAGDMPLCFPENQYFTFDICREYNCHPAFTAFFVASDDHPISTDLINSFGAGILWQKENSAAFTDPVLILHGGKDPLASEKDARDLFGDLASEDKSLRIYGGLPHELLQKQYRGQVVGDILRWIEARI